MSAEASRPSLKGMLRIGALPVVPALDEIEREGQNIKLEPRAMRLLMCLARTVPGYR